MEIVHADFGVIVIPAITVGVNGGDGAARGIPRDCADAPGIIGISHDGEGILVHDGDDVTLEILPEVERLVVVNDTADAVLVVVQRGQRIAVPSLPENLRTFQQILVADFVDRFAGADTVGIVGV